MLASAGLATAGLAKAGPTALTHMSYFQAAVIGLIQGVFELFPLSSLGHTVLIPSWIGGSWASLVHQESRSESPYLAFVVGLHLANAVALLLFYLREWGRLIAGFCTSVVRRRVVTDTERLAWLIVIATIPVGIAGLLLEHTFRVVFAKPLAAALFLCVNGLILFAGERVLRRRRAAEAAADKTVPATGKTVPTTATAAPATAAPATASTDPATGASAPARRPSTRPEELVVIDAAAEKKLAGIGVPSAFVIGLSQTLALLAGISRSGVVLVGGLYRGLDRESALRFAFLLSTPVIFAAGALKIGDLLGPLGSGIRGQVVVGSLVAVVTSLAAIFLIARYFRSRSGSLAPFAIYSLLFGVASVFRFGLF